jgi:alpha-ketoglutarate-dependent 2,4-dichlorophenoxyacetate dioxygenase
MPEYFVDTDPMKLPLSKHLLVQKHEWSGRTVSKSRSASTDCSQLTVGPQNLYIASYVHHIDDIGPDESRALINDLLNHVSQPKYRLTIQWRESGDLIIWDNTCVMHRATGGSYEGRYRRDMRRTTVKDMGPTRFGLNGEGASWRVGLP